MHIRKLSLRNIRSIESFDLELGADELAGWHVILGDNGAGKSSVIRSIALPLIGPMEAQALRQDWSNWLRNDSDSGSISATIVRHYCDFWPGTGGQAKGDVHLTASFKRDPSTPRQSVGIDFNGAPGQSADRTVWGSGQGWFAASFGPFRRFSGGDPNQERLFYSNPKAAAHLSAFGEEVALTEALRWIQQLHVKSLESGGVERTIKDSVVSFINDSNLLPHDARISDISSDGVTILDGDGNAIPVERMSDGYRSILSLTFELLRQMFINFDKSFVISKMNSNLGQIDIPGIVAIDEIDAHLHPAWQKRIGQWFTTRFPQIQFFVTTHSPIICQAASRGSIWRLPSPGTTEQPRRIRGDDLNRLIYGSVLDAYGTQFFGVGVTRSDTSKEQLVELARLNRKSLTGALDDPDSIRLNELRATMPSVAAKVAGDA